jgi:hypothetical protein
MNSAIQGIMKRFVVTYQTGSLDNATDTMVVTSNDIFSALAQAQNLLHKNCVILTIKNHD